jgi:hypothetical protein
MSTWMLLVLIGLAWLSYPVAGGAQVAADVAEGKRPQDAGFSFLPELIVFPAAFFGVAALIDFFFKPWGRWIVGGLSVAVLAVNVYVFARSMFRLRRARKSAA